MGTASPANTTSYLCDWEVCSFNFHYDSSLYCYIRKEWRGTNSIKEIKYWTEYNLILIAKDFKYLLSLPSLWSLLTQGVKMLHYRCWGETKRNQQMSFQVVCNSPSSSNLFYSRTQVIIPGFSVLAIHRLFHFLFIEKTQIFPYMKA